jgi:preprotein translocase subunit SecD
MLYFSKLKIILIVATVIVGVAYAIPSLLPQRLTDGLPSWIQKRVVLGLDLQGGLHLLMHVEIDQVLRERTESIVENIRAELRKANIQYRNLGTRGSAAATVSIIRPEDVQRARELIAPLEAGTNTVVEGDRITVGFTEQALRDFKNSIVSQSMQIVRLRIDETGAKDPTLVQQGEDRILLQLPGVDDPERVKKLLNTTAKMSFHLMCDTGGLEPAPGQAVPPGCISVPSGEARSSPRDGPAAYSLRRKVEVSGDRLVDAQPNFDQRSGQPIVNFRFDRQGARQFGDITAANVNKPFAIVLDNKVISAPVIREPILGGSGQISGGFTVKDAQDLALLLRAGALPAPVTFLEERTVGPDLGADSIRAGTIACIIGYLLIVVLMIVGYGVFGVVANIALLLNLAFTLAIMAWLSATLTLPGIAGMVLGLAMAVDANVLIYERMREESDRGRSPFPAVDTAFQRAFGTIIDSNLTTLIAAVLLYLFGSGPVRGFAVTLSIGIACSMFTAVTVTKLLCVSVLTWLRPKVLPV